MNFTTDTWNASGGAATFAATVTKSQLITPNVAGLADVFGGLTQVGTSTTYTLTHPLTLTLTDTSSKAAAVPVTINQLTVVDNGTAGTFTVSFSVPGSTAILNMISSTAKNGSNADSVTCLLTGWDTTDYSGITVPTASKPLKIFKK